MSLLLRLSGPRREREREREKERERERKRERAKERDFDVHSRSDLWGDCLMTNHV